MDIRKICDSVETDVSGRYEEIKGKVMPSDFVQMYMSYFGWPEYVKVSETISERSGVTNEEVDEWITEHPEIIVEEYEKSVLPKDYEGFTEYAERMWTKYRAPKDSTPLKDSTKELSLSPEVNRRVMLSKTPEAFLDEWEKYRSEKGITYDLDALGVEGSFSEWRKKLGDEKAVKVLSKVITGTDLFNVLKSMKKGVSDSAEVVPEMEKVKDLLSPKSILSEWISYADENRFEDFLRNLDRYWELDAEDWDIDEWIDFIRDNSASALSELEAYLSTEEIRDFAKTVIRLYDLDYEEDEIEKVQDSSNKGFERMKELLSPDGVIFAWKSYSSPGKWSDFLTYLRNNQEELRGKSGAELEDYIQYNASDFIPEFESYLSPEEIEDFTQYLARTYELEDEIEDAAPEERMSERIKSGVYEKLPLGWAFSEATEADARNYTLFVDVVKAADKSSLAQKIAEFLGAEQTAKLAGFLNKELGLGVKSRINK